MRRIVALGGLIVVALALVVGQLALPGLAATKLRERLARSGKVLSVQVSAFPAIELLWHDADRVKVRMASYHSSVGGVGTLLDQTAGVSSLDVSVGTLQSGRLALQNVTLTKSGQQLSGAATVTEAALRRALPIIDSVAPVSSGGGGLVLRGTVGVSCFTGSLDFTVATRDGQAVVAPDLPLLGSLLTFTVFSNPHVYVESVGGGASAKGLSVSARARLR